MHKLALLPILALLIALLFAGREEAPLPASPSYTEAPPEAAVSETKPFRPVWEAELVKEGLLGLPLTPQACITPNCAGCDLDKSAFFRKKPGHPKFQ